MHGERGQATLEMALCLPLVAVIAALMVESALLLADRARLWHAAREAARVAAVDDDAGRIEAAARRSGLDPSHVDIEPSPNERRQGDPITVRVGYRPEPHVPLVGNLFREVELMAEATMRIEEP